MSAERRRAPRFIKRLPVHVQELELFTANLSATGMQLICPEAWVPHLDAQLAAKTLSLGIQISEEERLSMDASVAYVSAADDEVLIGIHFETAAAEAKQRWLQFVEAAAGPEYVM